MATDEWTASMSGNWTTGTDWGGGEPTNSSDVVIASDNDITVNSPASSVVVNTISVNATDVLSIQNGSNDFTATDGAPGPTFGDVDVGDGNFVLGSAGTSTIYGNAGFLLLDSSDPPNLSVLFIEGNVSFIDRGTIQLSTDAIISGDFSDSTLTNVDNTVVADSGDIRALNFINEATVEVGTGGSLMIEGSAEGGSFDNQNLLRTNEGSTLVLGEGEGHNATIANAGTIELQNNDSGFTTTMEIAGNVTIDCTGAGNILLSGANSDSSSIVSTGGTATLTLVGDGTGSLLTAAGGSIGDANLTLNLQNFNIVEASSMSEFVVVAAANTTLDSNSSIVAENNGEIFLEGPISDGGAINASEGGEIFVSGNITEQQGAPAINIGQGGTLSLTSTGRISGFVVFAGTDATLKVAIPSFQQISESLVNAAAGDNIDLTYQAFDPSLVAVWLQGGTAGTLEIEKNGVFQTAVSLAGQYTSGDFALSNDGNGDTLVQVINSGPNPSPPAATTADIIMRDGSNGDYEIFDLGNNAIQAAYTLGQAGTEWRVAGLGDFDGADTSDMMLRNSGTGALEIYDVSDNNVTNAAFLGQVGLEWQVAGFGDFSSKAGETDMLMRDSNNGAFEIYDISNNTITNAASMGQVGLEWSVAGFGDFSGRANETDMLMRNNNTGAFEIYDISNNQLTSFASMGQVGLEWSVAGFGDFSGNANETDMLMRNTNTGAFEIYDITNNQLTNFASMGQVGLSWQVVGFGPIDGAGLSDMLMRNTGSGAFEIFDIGGNQLTNAAPIGQVGTEWSVAGIAADPSGGSSPVNAQLTQAVASFGSASGALNTSALLSQTTTQSTTVSPLAASTG